jgi:hypothetical protein
MHKPVADHLVSSLEAHSAFRTETALNRAVMRSIRGVYICVGASSLVNFLWLTCGYGNMALT